MLLRKDTSVAVPNAFRPDHWVLRCAVAVPRGRMAEAFCLLPELKLPELTERLPKNMKLLSL
ncbi:hypothetical protein BS78_09G101200 [Paspalum vaginatum]|nr:hypothetical protein BS78_09G101200 [Paspalum vaginatum]